MPKSRHRKNHKQKASARKKQVQENKTRMEKLQRKFLMDLIQREQDKGLFNNTTPIDDTTSVVASQNPLISGPELPTEGPSI
jgi:hypothetical protein